MEQKKTIQFNPELLKIQSRRKTQKNLPKEPKEPKEIKYKNKTMNRQLMNRVQSHVSAASQSSNPLTRRTTESNFFVEEKTDFEKSLDFLEKMSKEKAAVSCEAANNIQIFYPDDDHQPTQNTDFNQGIGPVEKPVFTGITEAPPWGILKNGNLPTKRSYFSNSNEQPMQVNSAPEMFYNPKPEEFAKPPKIHNSDKIKKTIRRTYKTGKNEKKGKVAILLPNKTMRNKIENAAQDLKSIPMSEIKKNLIEKNLIKASATAPNDVLRKMYESSQLTAGEIKNHNENVLFNYLHGSSHG